MAHMNVRGPKTARTRYLQRIILSRIMHRIAAQNIKKYPQLTVFAFDHIGLIVNIDGRYERESLETLRLFLEQVLKVRTDAVAIDIGANIGNHSVFFSDMFSTVISYEPNPTTFALLKTNCLGRNITPFNYGLSSAQSTLAFCVDSANVGGSYIIDSNSIGSPPSGSIHIEVKRLDDEDFISKNSISLIKIDVEGHELDVLRGSVETIEAARPVIVFEQREDEIECGSSAVIDFLRGRRYAFYTIENNFYLGPHIFARRVSLLLRLFFGFRKTIAKTDYFKKRFHDMIIAVPSDI